MTGKTVHVSQHSQCQLGTAAACDVLQGVAQLQRAMQPRTSLCEMQDKTSAAECLFSPATSRSSVSHGSPWGLCHHRLSQTFSVRRATSKARLPCSLLELKCVTVNVCRTQQERKLSSCQSRSRRVIRKHSASDRPRALLRCQLVTNYGLHQR